MPLGGRQSSLQAHQAELRGRSLALWRPGGGAKFSRGRGRSVGGPSPWVARSGAWPRSCPVRPRPVRSVLKFSAALPASSPRRPPASRFLSRPGSARSDNKALEKPPSPPPPPRAQTSPGLGKVGVLPNRRLGAVRGGLMSSPPGRRARLASPGTSRPSSEAREELRRRLRDLIEGNRVMIFSKSYCPHSTRVGGAGRSRALGRGLMGRV